MALAAIRQGARAGSITVYGAGMGGDKTVTGIMDCGHWFSVWLTEFDLIEFHRSGRPPIVLACTICGEAEREAIVDERPETD